MGRDVKGFRHADHMHPVKTVEQLYDTYEWASFAVATGTTDYDVDTQQAALFAKINKAWMVMIWSNYDITVKFNSTGNPGIFHEAALSPHEWRNILAVTNLFISNSSGNSATVKVMII